MAVEFYAVVWCPDCNGVDFEGCFGGDVERLGPFTTREEADKEGSEMAGQSIWKYELRGGGDMTALKPPPATPEPNWRERLIVWLSKGYYWLRERGR